MVAVDADVGNNSLVLYNILGIRYIKQHSNDSEEVANIFSIGVYPECHGSRGPWAQASLWLKTPAWPGPLTLGL